MRYGDNDVHRAVEVPTVYGNGVVELTNRELAARAICTMFSIALLSTACTRGSSNPKQATGISTPPSSLVEVYLTPGQRPTDDGRLYSVSIRSGFTSKPASLGPALSTHVAYAPSASNEKTMLVVSYAAQNGPTLRAMSASGSQLASKTLGTGDAVVAAAAVGGVDYAQIGTSVVGYKNEQQVSSYQLSALQPDPAAGDLPPGYKGDNTGTGVGAVNAFIVGSDNHLLALRSTGRAAAISDLTGGRTVSLGGLTQLDSAAIGHDGMIYAVGWRRYDSSYTIKLAVLEPSALAISHVYDLGVTTDNLHDVSVVPSSTRNVVVGISSGLDPSIAMRVWSVSNGAMQSGPSLPPGIGLDLTGTGGDGIYLFGGPARNRVSMYDFPTGALTQDDPTLRAPAGTFVTGVWAS